MSKIYIAMCWISTVLFGSMILATGSSFFFNRENIDFSDYPFFFGMSISWAAIGGIPALLAQLIAHEYVVKKSEKSSSYFNMQIIHFIICLIYTMTFLFLEGSKGDHLFILLMFCSYVPLAMVQWHVGEMIYHKRSKLKTGNANYS